IERRGSNNHNKAMWFCKCECGKDTIIVGNNLKTGTVNSCGCLKKVNDYTNKRFGKLLVIKKVRNPKTNKNGWLCQCDCGKTAIVSGGNLGGTRSCGCISENNFIGQKFGKLLVIKQNENRNK